MIYFSGAIAPPLFDAIPAMMGGRRWRADALILFTTEPGHDAAIDFV